MTSAGGAVATPSPIPPPSAGYIALTSAAFLAALVASCALLGRILPFPGVPNLQEKMEQLARFGDEYDVLFLGSSRVHFQIMPAIFDQIAHENGLPIRSFNAGAAAMVPPEDNYWVDQILRRPHRRLRWVFLELMPLGAKGNPTLTGTSRYSYWHDWERTRLLTESSLAECVDRCHEQDRSRMPWADRVADYWPPLRVWLENLGLFALRLSNIGRGEEWLRQQFGQTKERKDISLQEGLSWDGWAFPNVGKSMAGNEKRRADYDHAYASLLETEQRFDGGDAVSWEALSIKITRLTAAGVTPILIIPPTTAAKRYLPSELAGKNLMILDFSDPRKYPELFSPDHRVEGVHLNDVGAKIFTLEIARDFVAAMKKPGPNP